MKQNRLMSEVRKRANDGDGAGRPFDNVLFRLRGNRCVVALVAPPFATMYWPDVGAVTLELGLPQGTVASLQESESQRHFLSALADGAPIEERFRPFNVGFSSNARDLRRLEESRRSHRRVLFLGAGSRAVMLGALETVTATLPPGGVLDVELKHWDALADWTAGQERLSEICAQIFQVHGLRSNLLAFSELRALEKTLWEFVYNHPRVRIAWIADELLGCVRQRDFQERLLQSPALSNLGKLTDMGVWPHVILPVGNSNLGSLQEIVRDLLELTRGGSIEVVPEALFHAEPCVGAPPVEEYVGALLALYEDPQIPIRLVSPLSWVAARIESATPLDPSRASVGAEFAVLPNGDIYTSEFAVGIERWRLGNVLKDVDHLRWERLDVMPEAFSKPMQPERCKSCDWRYRCGGMDASVFLLQQQCERRSHSCGPAEARREGRPKSHSGSSSEWPESFELYCAPRKRLFEEMLWSSAEGAAQAVDSGPRERLELSDQGISYVPAANQAQTPFAP